MVEQYQDHKRPAEPTKGQAATWRVCTDTRVAWILGAIFSLVYLRTLCPTVYLGDSGEIATAISSGGIIHPPGYPLFSLLGRAAVLLIPFGEPAFRIGCWVALAAALAVAVLYRIGREIGTPSWASAAAAAVFGTSFTFWNQSTRVEVYSTHLLLSLMMLLWALRYRNSRQNRDLFLATLAGSLGLAHHLTIVLLVPGLLLLFGKSFWNRAGLAGRLSTVLTVLPVGPGLYAALAIWARQDPLYAWGYPATAPLLWDHASAKLYHNLLHFPTWSYLSTHLPLAGRLYLDNFPSVLLLLPLAGGASLWKRDRALAAGLLAIPAVITAYNQCYRISDIAPYYLNAFAVLGVLLGAGLAAARRLVRDSRFATVLQWGVVAALCGLGLLRNWAACDLSRTTFMRDFARHKLESADPNAVLITQSDDDAFPVWYVHDILHVRPDVIPLDRLCVRCTWQGDPSLWYLRHLRHRGLDIPLERVSDAADLKFRADDGYLVSLIRHQLRGRPLNITFFDDPTKYSGRPFMRWAGRRYQQVPIGLLIRLQPKGEEVKLGELLSRNAQLWSRMRLPVMGHARTDQDLDGDYIIEQYASMLVNFGGLYQASRKPDKAEEIYRRAAEWAPRSRAAQSALGSLLGDRKLKKQPPRIEPGHAS